MKGWHKQQNVFVNRPLWTRLVGERTLSVLEISDEEYSAYANGGKESFPLYNGWNGLNATPWTNPQDAAKALMDRERQRALRILADLEDPE